MSTRPSKNAAAPAPVEGGRYCHTCGRVISPRKANPRTPPSTPQKYCSDRCRREKPSPTGRGVEAEIERAFVRLLGDGPERRVVGCGDVQGVVFKWVRGRGGEGCGVEAPGAGEDGVVAEEDGDEDENEDDDGGVRLPTSSGPSLASENVFGVGNGHALSPHASGLKVAREREQVRQAARRGVAFGFCIVHGKGGDGGVEGRRRVEAVQNGRVVEASFAKGEWGVRWKE